ncbi:MAG TPA: substrate-binding domain-containing protein [Candidatus Aquabacterium excrementipullorum]|nr:substrate-binding domain-containing protein [Candidatus Aquabacterium excrementipullorum]
MSSSPLRGISSMATRQLLADLAQAWTAHSGQQVAIESVGGVDAAKRVEAGEAFDVVVLADDAIGKLAQAGAVSAPSTTALVRSGVAACVKAGEPLPPFATEAQVRQAVLAAHSIGYSTGPSGTALLQLFERWGVLEQLRPRLVQARAGVPVGSLVASGEVRLGFQQLSELIHVQGIGLIGPLPDEIQITTVFSGAVCTRATQPGAAADFLRFLASPEAANAKRQQGMQPA